jgi:hypothetical protein
VQNFRSEKLRVEPPDFARIFYSTDNQQESHRIFFLLALMVLYSGTTRAYDRNTSIASSVQTSAPANEKFFSTAALLWPAAGNMKSVKDATQENDPLRR